MSTPKVPGRPQQKLNKVTLELEEYPMEELARIRGELKAQGRPIYDFGTGDPRVPVWSPIREALLQAVPEISQYPSVKGLPSLKEAHQGYLERRFGIQPDSGYEVIPTSGSKEAIFHIALTLVGRANGKKHIVYPDPGYPVYRSSAKFAGGVPFPVRLEASQGYLLEPWNLPPYIQRDTAALWLNYPHNPTGATAPRDYWEEVVAWCHKTDTVLLSDDCYVDLYDSAIDKKPIDDPEDDGRPFCPLKISSDRVLSFQSLSKRSGLTGYRAGFVAGDAEIIKGFLRARANFGVAQPDFVQAAATIAWNNDEHVRERREIFTQRLAMAAPVFQELGLLDELPKAGIYLWTRIPAAFGTGDVRFCVALAEQGVICSPSSWLSEGLKGWVRFAMVPETSVMAEALTVIKDYIES